MPAAPDPLAHRQEGYDLLAGRGLEVGAFHHPATLPEGCAVEYCDVCTRAEASERFPELDPGGLVEVDHLCDLDREGLAIFADGAFDFVVCNHVIEHVANPIRTLGEVFRVARPGGLVVLAAPDRRFTFDRDRPLTPFAHLRDEYERGISVVTDEHYLDFLTHVHPEVMSSSPEEIAAHVASVRARREHAHVWDSASFEEFLERALGLLGIRATPLLVRRGDENGYEHFSVWRKEPAPGRDGP